VARDDSRETEGTTKGVKASKGLTSGSGGNADFEGREKTDNAAIWWGGGWREGRAGIKT